MVVFFLDVFDVDELCSILLTYVNLVNTANLATIAQKERQLLMQEHLSVYSVMQNSSTCGFFQIVQVPTGQPRALFLRDSNWLRELSQRLKLITEAFPEAQIYHGRFPRG